MRISLLVLKGITVLVIPFLGLKTVGKLLC